MVDGELKHVSGSFTESQRNEVVETVAQRIGYMSADDLYNTLGYGGVALSKVSGKIKDEYERTFGAQNDTVIPEEIKAEDVKTVAPKNIKSNGGIIVDGLEGCLVKFARCCNPLPGDKVIGFITKGYGISIHKQDCPNVIGAQARPDDDKSRWLEAHWDNGGVANRTSQYEAMLQVYADDSIGVLADISVALADMRVSILQVNTAKRQGEKVMINLKISCKNTEHYSSIVARIKGLKHVISVTRGYV
jgi:GTP pyrophosphokinase